ncbi:MAG: WG repeat-containing protein [Flavobacteriales bacterium]|nr:WG repeat-containing protein [Flavobacteriales bacterium]
MELSVRRCLLQGSLVLSLLPLSVSAGKLEKAFAALSEHNYFLARDLFQKEVRKHPAAAWYGLSVIHGRDNNPFYQLDSAYAFIQRADVAFSMAPDKERVAVGKVGVTGAAIEAQKEHIYGIAWDQAKSVNSIASYDRFITTYHQSARVADARAIRDHIAFQEARTTNTAAAFQTFIKRYPEAKDVYEARSRLQEAVFREAVPNGTITEYQRFLSEHPDSPYVRKAEDEIFRLSTPHRTPMELHGFIASNPKNPNVPDAWRAIYDQYTRDLSAGAITQFLKDYPDYPFINELTADYRTASMVLYPFRKDGKWGYINEEGVEQVKALYDLAEPFAGGQALVGVGDRVGTINKMGREVVEVQYDDVLDPSEGLITVDRAGHVGVVDRGGRLVVPMEYEDVGEFRNGIAYAEKEGRYGYINVAGEVVVPFQYEKAGTYQNGLAVVVQNGQSGVIDAKGGVVIPFEYDWIEGFALPVSRVRKGARMGLVSPFGDMLLAVEHDHVGVFNNGLALVVDGTKCGYVDQQGGLAIPMQYEANEGTLGWGDFHNGIAKVMVAGKFGCIDTKGAKVLAPQYTDIGIAVSGVIPVKKKTKWGYLNRAGAALSEFKYDQAWELRQGFARVKIGELFGLVDSTAKELIAPRFTGLSDVQHNMLIATLYGKMGVIDLLGKERIPLLYEAAELMDARTVKVSRSGKLAYVRLSDGQFIWKEEGFDVLPE